jgi:excisionase family DNA binding protein
MLMDAVVPSPPAAEAEPPFLAEVQRGLTGLASEYHSAEATLDLLFLSYLLQTSRFGYFTYGPVTIDVRVVEDLVARTIARSSSQTAPVRYSEDCLSFFRTLSEEVERSGRRRVDELHLLLAFMRVKEGIPGRVFSELGVRPEEVLRYVPERAPSERRLYTPEEAAEYLGVHVKTVRNWIRTGRLPASRLAGQRALRIRAADLERILEPVDPTALDDDGKDDV